MNPRGNLMLYTCKAALDIIPVPQYRTELNAPLLPIYGRSYAPGSKTATTRKKTLLQSVTKHVVTTLLFTAHCFPQEIILYLNTRNNYCLYRRSIIYDVIVLFITLLCKILTGSFTVIHCKILCITVIQHNYV